MLGTLINDAGVKQDIESGRKRAVEDTETLRPGLSVAGRGGGVGFVRGHLRVGAGVAKEARAPLSSLARAPEGLSDSVWLRGPARLESLARRPIAQGGLRLLPESGANLASQPTISQLENAPTRRSCHRIAQALFELYLSERGKDGPPRRCFWTSTPRTILPTGSRKVPTTKAITLSTCIIRF